jgi:NAD+ diphosphatase
MTQQITGSGNFLSQSPSDSVKNTYVLIVDSGRVLVRLESDKTGVLCLSDFQADLTKLDRTEFLGVFDGHPCYCLSFGDDIIPPEHTAFKSLWDLLWAPDETLMYPLFKAVHIVHWLRQSAFCGVCGNPTAASDTERARVCTVCGNILYPRISPAIIIAVVKDGRLLLAHNSRFPEGRYSLIAGFVEPGETFEDTAKREALEETGISIKNIKYFGSQPWPFPDSLMIGLTAEYAAGEITPDGTEIDKAAWFDAEHLPDIPGTASIAGKLIAWFAGGSETFDRSKKW